MNEVRIPYRPNKLIFLFVIAFFGVCAAAMGNVALGNEQGLILNRILEFSPQGATVLYWAICLVASAFVLFSILVLVKSAASSREIVISASSITLPKSGFSKLNVTIGFSDIVNVTVQTVHKTKILNIDHVSGRLSVPNSMVPSAQSFDLLVSQLQAKLDG